MFGIWKPSEKKKMDCSYGLLIKEAVQRETQIMKGPESCDPKNRRPNRIPKHIQRNTRFECGNGLEKLDYWIRFWSEGRALTEKMDKQKTRKTLIQ